MLGIKKIVLALAAVAALALIALLAVRIASPAREARAPAPQPSTQTAIRTRPPAEANGKEAKTAQSEDGPDLPEPEIRPVALAGTSPGPSADFARQESQRGFDIANAKRDAVFRALTPYHVAEADLKEKVKARYGPITSDKVEQLVKTAAALEDDFWAKGDFDDAANMNIICESRALLESCLDVSPDNEQALRQLVEVIQAGWPTSYFTPEDTDAVKADDLYQRRYDLYIVKSKLWTLLASRGPASTFNDMCLAFDMVDWVQNDPIFGKPQDSLLAGLKAVCPNPSPEVAGLIAGGVPLQQRIEVAKWAMEGAQKQGGKWMYYADYFKSEIDYYEGRSSAKYPPYATFTVDPRTPRNQKREGFELEGRFSCGRGCSFRGPAVWRNYYIPMHEKLLVYPLPKPGTGN